MRVLTPDNLVRVDTPAILIDWLQLEANVSSMAELCRTNGVRMMPHIKTHKSVEIAKLQLETGAVGLTCAKLSEAKAMLPSGVKHIFLAHSLVSPTKLPTLKELASELDELIVAVTSPKQLNCLEALLKKAELTLPCLLAFNTGLGREGARGTEELVEMKHAVDASAYLTYRGIYSHEGHTYMSVYEELELQAKDVAAQLRNAREALGGQGELWPGCSVTASRMVRESDITGVRPGAYLFGDLFLTERTGAMGWEELSVSVAATVIDRPEPGLALIDAGTKVFSSDKHGDTPYARPLDRRDFAATGLSEEHGFLTGAQVNELKIGEVIQFIPQHICPVVNLTSILHRLDDKDDISIIPVEARGCVT